MAEATRQDTAGAGPRPTEKSGPRSRRSVRRRSGRPADLGSRKRSPTKMTDEEMETTAVVMIHKALRRLGLDSRRKVLSWFMQTYGVSAQPARGAKEEAEYEDLAAVFEAARPNSEAERVLIACYFHTQVLGEQDVEGRTLAKDLRQMGQASTNISNRLRELNVRTPSLLMMTSKANATHRRYRTTSAGNKCIEGMIARQSADS